MIDPERLDLDSASSAYARRRCAGRSNLIRALHQAGKLERPQTNQFALSGTRVHAAWAGASCELEPAEAETLGLLQKLERLVLADWAGDEQYTLLGREQRLWLHEGLEPLHSGQYDVAYGTLSSRRMLIIDAKTLYAEVLPAEANDQMRELVGLARFNYPACQEFTVAILQPRLGKRPSIAVYDAAEAELALRLLGHSIENSADPDAPRTAGPWCEHCPAISHCEEARAAVGKTYDLAKRIQEGEYVLPLGERGSRFLDSIATASKVLDAMRGRYKELLSSDPLCVPGWYLKDGVKVREITSVKAAYELASSIMSLDEFLSAVEVKIGPLEARVGKKRFNSVFESVLSIKQNAPTLCRRTKELDQ